MKLKLSLIILFLFLLFPINKTEASGIKLGIYPPLIEIEAIPPAKTEATITLVNFEEEEISLKILFRPFKPSSKENGEIEFLSENAFFEDDPLLFQKIKVLDQEKEINEVVLGPKQKKDLSLIVDIPKEQTLSDYYFSIIFVSSNKPDDQSTKSVSEAGIATNVLLSIGPKDMAKGSIEEFSTPLFLESGPVPFTLRVKNKGNHFITPKGEILIKNIFGQVVGRVDLLPVNILSRSTRFIPDSLQNPFATGSANTKYNPPAGGLNTKYAYPVAYWHENFLLGPYSASLTIALSENGPLFKRTVFFFAFPIKILLGIIVAVLVIIFIYKRVKQYKKG